MNMTPEQLKGMLSQNPSLLARNANNTQLKSVLVQGFKNKPVNDSSDTVAKDDTKSKKKSSKYRNIKVYVYEDGFVSNDNKLELHGKIKAKYDSTKEYNRHTELLLLQKAGKISELKRQVKLLIQSAFDYRGEHIAEISYVADYVYIRNGETIIEDVKGYSEEQQKYILTKDFVLKWKLLKARYPEYCFEIY